MSHPTTDGEHAAQPYLPREPADLVASGDYAADIDIMIGNVCRY